METRGVDLFSTSLGGRGCVEGSSRFRERTFFFLLLGSPFGTYYNDLILKRELRAGGGGKTERREEGGRAGSEETRVELRSFEPVLLEGMEASKV